jgi:hypothetical protein
LPLALLAPCSPLALLEPSIDTRIEARPCC